MSKLDKYLKDYEEIIGHWKFMVDQLTEVNESLRAVIESQDELIQKLATKPKKD